MKLKYIPIFFKYFRLIDELTTEEKGEWLDKEIKFFTNNEQPEWSNKMQDLLHSLLIDELTEIASNKKRKQEYDSQRYQNNKKRENEN